MFNIDEIKQSTDCRDVIEQDLGAPKRHSSACNMYKCPLHNETKGYSLAVYQDHWKCFGKCQTGGDAIAWLQQYHGLSFKDACQRLGGEIASRPLKPRPRPQFKESPAEPPGLEWQTAALKLVEQAEATLWSPAGTKALDYLMHTRGLWPQTIRMARLGFIPGGHQDWNKREGLTVPCGILIPWVCGGVVWAINVRRAAGEPKYQQVSGGHIRGALFMADEILPRWPVLFTEGEFDCLIVWQCAQDFVCPVTLGGASNALHSRWFPQLVSAGKLLVITDHDEAGDKAGARLQQVSSRAKRITVPNGKDFNDFYLDSNLAVVAAWVEALVK